MQILWKKHELQIGTLTKLGLGVALLFQCMLAGTLLGALYVDIGFLGNIHPGGFRVFIEISGAVAFALLPFLILYGNLMVPFIADSLLYAMLVFGIFIDQPGMDHPDIYSVNLIYGGLAAILGIAWYRDRANTRNAAAQRVEEKRREEVELTSLLRG